MNGKAKWSMVTALTLLLPNLATAAPHIRPDAIERAQLLDVMKLDGELFHVQGVELDGSRIWVTSVDLKQHRGYIHEFDRSTGKFLRRLELTDGLRFHPGGISIQARSIWVPVAELKRNSSTVIEEIDADSLQIRSKIYVADHLGCVAASETNLIAANWNSKKIYTFDLKNEDKVRITSNHSLTHYQDMKLVGDELVASGSRTRHSGTIDWIDWRSMKLSRSLWAGATNKSRLSKRERPYTAEGMALEGRDLYLMPEDGPSRLFHFRLDGWTDIAAKSGTATKPDARPTNRKTVPEHS